MESAASSAPLPPDTAPAPRAPPEPAPALISLCAGPPARFYDITGMNRRKIIVPDGCKPKLLCFHNTDSDKKAKNDEKRELEGITP